MLWFYSSELGLDASPVMKNPPKLEGDATDGSFASKHGRHVIGHIDDYSALREQIGEGRLLVKKISLRAQSVQFNCCRVRLFVTPWTAATQASLSITNSQSVLKPMSIESVMPSNHLILCHPLLLPSIFLSIRVYSNELVLHIRWPEY